MIRNFFLMALRNSWRDKYYTSINVLGLALGFASCLLIYAYVRQQLSFDNFHPDKERLYRVNQTAIWSPEGGIMPSTCIPLAEKLLQDYEEVEEAIRINTPGAKLVVCENGNEHTSFYEDNILAVDSNFFSFFGFELLQGDPAEVLKGKNKVVLSYETAQKLFGDKEPVGKTLLMGDDRVPIIVTGVAAPQPDNSHFQFDYLISLYTNPNIKEFEWSWIWTQIVTYVKLRPGTDPSSLEKKFEVMAEKYVGPVFARFGMNYTDFIKGKGGWNFYLQPVEKIYLYSDKIGNRLGPTSNILYVYIFSIVGFFILILAAVNFINLSTARGARRAKEVGIKKTLGSQRSLLIFQFLFETILLALLSAVLGFGLAELLKIMVNITIDESLKFTITGIDLMVLFLILSIGIGFLAGLYPALYLTSFKPIEVLKGKLALGFKKSSLRNVLVIGQFVVSISFLIATVIVYQQLDYFRNKDLGFDKNQILVVNHADKLGKNLEAYRNEMQKVSGVISLSLAMEVPGRGSFEEIFKKEGDETQYPIAQVKIDEDYLATMDIKLAAGRNFEKDRVSDINHVLLNETTARMLGWTPQEAIGKRIIYLGDDIGPQEVIGVVKDYHFQDLNMDIGPMIFFHLKSTFWGDNRLLVLKFDPRQTQELVGSLESTWKEFNQEAPFEYSFLDEEWAGKYKAEKKLGGLFAIFTTLSMIIALVGLIGLVTYAAEQRKKEMGIRKTFGASTSQLAILLSKNFIRPVLVSFLLAAPLSWWSLTEWLSQFPYRIDLDIWVFVAAGLVMIIVSWLAVGYQSIRVAKTNPTDVLKDE